MSIKYPAIALLLFFGLSSQALSLPTAPTMLAAAAPNAKSIANGKKVFEKTCASCHGKTGKGDTAMGKALKARDLTTGKFTFGATDAALTKTITKGQGKMPGFNKLSKNEVTDLLAFIKSLQKKK